VSFIPTPPRLLKAKTKAAAITAAAMVTTAALTVGLTSPTLQAETVDPPVAAAEEQRRVVDADVDLAAAIGLYGVGPAFWMSRALGLSPENFALTLLGGLGIPLPDLDALDLGTPGPLPRGVYNAVNGLEYSTDAVLGLFSALPAIPLGPVTLLFVNETFDLDLQPGATSTDALGAIIDNFPVLNQRRAFLLSEGFGGLTTSLAYRAMIDAVTGDSAGWGAGVTSQVLAFLNNPSRPGGGALALLTPFTDLFGLNLSTPEAGSYTNGGLRPTKILNTSILDVSWSYNASSDVPTTLNPLAWLNAVAGSMFLTALIPDGLDLTRTNLDQLTPDALEALANAGVVLGDLTGGQGLDVVPVVGDLLQFLDELGVPVPTLPIGKGKSYYLTYDSGNLPLLEPFDIVPRLLGLLGINVPQPLINSIENALRKSINMSYQDVDPVTLERRFDMGAEQALVWHNPLTVSQRVEARQTIVNTLVDDIQANLLNPKAWVPSFRGLDALNAVLDAVIANQIALTVAAIVNGGIDVVQDVANRVYDGLQAAFKPVLEAQEAVGAQVEKTIDRILRVQNDGAGGSGDGAQASLLARAGDDSSVNGVKPTAEQKVSPTSTPNGDVLEDATTAKEARAVAAALRAERKAARAELKEARAGAVKVRDSVDRAVGDVKGGAEKARDSVTESVSKAKERATERAERAARRDLAKAG
jgi:hypothetical protein